MPVGGEVVGRDSGHGERPARFVELEELWSGLGVATIGGDVDGFVAEEADAFTLCVFAEGAPLFGEEELEDLGFGNEVGRGFVDRPLVGSGEAVHLAERGEATPRFKPAGLFFAEPLEGGILLEYHGAAACGELQCGAQLIPQPTVVGPAVAPAA